MPNSLAPVTANNDKQLCDACTEKENDIPAVNYCIICNRKMCSKHNEVIITCMFGYLYNERELCNKLLLSNARLTKLIHMNLNFCLQMHIKSLLSETRKYTNRVFIFILHLSKTFYQLTSTKPDISSSLQNLYGT